MTTELAWKMSYLEILNGGKIEGNPLKNTVEGRIKGVRTIKGLRKSTVEDRNKGVKNNKRPLKDDSSRKE